ncbi:MAG: hypothetical protein GWM92_08530 [Gemmatimonadetes bacterium]|nr:hypothetical protein [Gemmatimonadota bacterium]NIR79452.1 hypothetical protein [Gemmatimonadota bacterium]NIT87316.1 hypothetical protein [Gemmatimonadota bacterium]NIU31160.1 hypothetical protein [Gemmatimonadota bacterium]NIU35886.1 hypothetical protein [Gemmatimonadota bacterium]
MSMHRRSLFVIPLLLAALAGCGSNPAAPPRLEGGVLATFDVLDEVFRVWTDDGEAIDQLFALRSGTSPATIPTGRLLPGPGRGDHNEPWSWHLDPDDFEIVELTIELCDGRPSSVEESLDYWIDTVERFCPWAAELAELEDYR